MLLLFVILLDDDDKEGRIGANVVYGCTRHYTPIPRNGMMSENSDNGFFEYVNVNMCTRETFYW